MIIHNYTVRMRIKGSERSERAMIRYFDGAWGFLSALLI